MNAHERMKVETPDRPSQSIWSVKRRFMESGIFNVIGRYFSLFSRTTGGGVVRPGALASGRRASIVESSSGEALVICVGCDREKLADLIQAVEDFYDAH